MLPSELADDLNTTPSVISKQLKIYFEETDRVREKRLSDGTIEDMRAVHDLLQSGKAQSFRQALHKLMGKVAEPVPADSAQQLSERMESLEASMQSLEGKFDELLRELRSYLAGQTQLMSTHAPVPAPSSLTHPQVPPQGS